MKKQKSSRRPKGPAAAESRHSLIRAEFVLDLNFVKDHPDDDDGGDYVKIPDTGSRANFHLQHLQCSERERSLTEIPVSERCQV